MLVATMSNGRAIRLIDVPGRQTVLIHPGNYPEDTEGCLLPGCGVGIDEIQSGTSKAAFSQIWDALNKNRYGGRIIIHNPNGR